MGFTIAGGDKYGTRIGVCCSIFNLIILIAYFLAETVNMFSFENTEFDTYVSENHFSRDEKFQPEAGDWNMAIGIFDQGLAPIDVPDLSKYFIFMAYNLHVADSETGPEFYFDQNGNLLPLGRGHVVANKCTEGDIARMYPRDSSATFFENYWQHMWCFGPHDFWLAGDFMFSHMSNIKVDVFECNWDGCASQQERDNLKTRYPYFQTMYAINQHHYDRQDYEEPIKRQAKIHRNYFGMNTSQYAQIYFDLNRELLTHSDKPLIYFDQQETEFITYTVDTKETLAYDAGRPFSLYFSLSPDQK